MFRCHKKITLVLLALLLLCLAFYLLLSLDFPHWSPPPAVQIASSSPAAVKDFPDFDDQPDSGIQKRPVSTSPRRRNALNGVPIDSDLDVFQVVGGADLFQKEPVQLNEFQADEEKVVAGLGEDGSAAQVPGAEEELAQTLMRTEAFNILLSDKISLHRSVPDTRDPNCRGLSYDRQLPSASVIIIFTNEAWSPLLRTVWSVLDKSPEEHLHEVILVDDASDKKHLTGKLHRYIQRKFPSKIKLIRLPSRQGLIRARLAGARAASGDVLLFLDSHCECGQDWLQPLLQRIKVNPKAFVVPIIDVIDDKTLEYYHGNGVYFQIGGFTWSGHFTWIDIPAQEQERRLADPVAPVRSPTMAGGLFAVDRHFFWQIGSYDEGMDVWGGENLEMSFRVWQCGGFVEVIPCSRVGHIFRSFHPYSFPGNKDTHGINTARTAHVWMDDYKRLFFMNRPDLLHADIGNVSQRLDFKRKSDCHPFSWYLSHVYPQKFVLDSPEHVIAYGRIRNAESNRCVDTMQHDEKDVYFLGSYPCHDQVASSQFFSFSRQNELRKEDACAEIDPLQNGSGAALPVKMAPCTGSEDQEWLYTDQGRLIHKNTDRCLALQQPDVLSVVPCKTSASQIWRFDSHFSPDSAST